MGPDVDRIAEVLDLALIVGRGDGTKDGGIVELFNELAGPDGRDENARKRLVNPPPPLKKQYVGGVSKSL
jgi:hypothetical protein